MTKINEVINSLNDEQITPEAREILKAEAIAQEQRESQLYSRAKKAEGFDKDKITGKWIKKEAKEIKPEAKTDTQGEFDYGQKAFLNTNGIKGADEMAKVKEFQAATGKSLDEIVENKYFLAELKEFRDDNAAKAAMPSGSRGGGGTSAKDTVDYWISKGEMPPADQPKLRQECVNARYAKEKGGSPFVK